MLADPLLIGEFPMLQNQVVVQLLLTGNEIMSGDTVDSNSAMIAQRLAELGMAVHRKVTVGDEPALLAKELSALCEASEVVIVNGGLGPTVDDLTAQVLAEVAGVPLHEHAAARQHLVDWCAKRNLHLNDANLKQALLPEGVELIDNPIGSAVGFQMTVGTCLVICTPGVPSELRLMLEPVLNTLSRQFGRRAQVDVIRLQTFGLGESTAQQIIADSGHPWPESVELGFRAGAPQMEIKLTINGAAAQEAQQQCRAWMYELFGDHIIGEGDASLAGRVLELLEAQGKTVSTAESCTGGLIASMLTRIPGSSTGFHAGFVTYSNPIKSSILGVSETSLESCGAVSEAVVTEMANGAIERSGSDYAIAVSGIAGPNGGTADKPVGTVWLAWGSSGKLQTRGLCWPVERGLFQTMIAAAGLDMLRRTLLDVDSEPRYFSQRSQRG
jgi:nicotinamide-nucleotide amidase